MPTSQGNPWTDLRVAVQARLEATVDDLTAFPWTGQTDQDVLRLGKEHGRVAWVRVSRCEAQEPAPRRQDDVNLEVAILAVCAEMNPAIAAVAGQMSTAHEQIESLTWAIRNQFRDCVLLDWLTGRGLEFVRQEVLYQDQVAVAVDLRFCGTGHVEVFGDSVSDIAPLPSRISSQYSTDGATWHDAYADGDAYVRWSLDYGETWGSALRFAGPQGATGAAGADGADGTIWQVGTGVPSDSLGNDGDWYLDTTGRAIYLKGSGTWALQAEMYPSAAAAASVEKSGADVAPDFSSNLTLVWSLTGNITSLAQATNLADGRTGEILVTLNGYGLPADPPSGSRKGSWVVTGTYVRIVVERVGSAYLWSADSLEVVS